MHGSDHIEWPAGDTAARVLGASDARRGPIANSLLAVLEKVYGAGVFLRNSAFDAGLKRVHRASIPVISVGNLVAGGAGKTPFTRWLVTQITARGRRVAILHGGYASDEPDLHRAWHTDPLVYEERDRVRAVKAAAAAGADVAVLDDAFQHRRLARDLDIVLIPAESASAHMLPLGPLREPEENMARADVVVVTRKTASVEAARVLAHHYRTTTGKVCAIAAILPSGLRNLADPSKTLKGEAVIATAIARPDLFLRQVREMGVPVARTLAYPDHYDYREKDTRHVLNAAGGRAIVTTEKDAVKLADLLPRENLWVVEQKVVFEEGHDAFLALLERVL